MAFHSWLRIPPMISSTESIRRLISSTESNWSSTQWSALQSPTDDLLIRRMLIDRLIIPFFFNVILVEHWFLRIQKQEKSASLPTMQGATRQIHPCRFEVWLRFLNPWMSIHNLLRYTNTRCCQSTSCKVTLMLCLTTTLFKLCASYQAICRNCIRIA